MLEFPRGYVHCCSHGILHSHEGATMLHSGMYVLRMEKVGTIRNLLHRAIKKVLCQIYLPVLNDSF